MPALAIIRFQNTLFISAFLVVPLLLVGCGGGQSTPPPSSTGTTGASVTISPVRAALTTGQAQTFTATVTGNAVTTVTWEVDSIPGGNSSVGTVTAAGVY